MRWFSCIDGTSLRLRAWNLAALGLPGGEAPGMKVIPVQARLRAVPVELELDLRLDRGHHFAADRAGRPVSAPAEPAVRGSRGQLPAADSRAGFFGKSRLFRHGSPHVWLWRSCASGPDRRASRD